MATSSSDELNKEYVFDYRTSRLNRFAGRERTFFMAENFKIMKIELFIDTSEELFSNWLRQFTTSMPYQRFPTEKGYMNLQSARRSPTLGGVELYLEGWYFVDKEDVTHAHPIGNVLTFKVISLAENRIEIQAECSQPVVQEYFLDLLEEIRRRWPQSPKVNQQIEEFRASVEAGLDEIKQTQGKLSEQVDNLGNAIRNIQIGLQNGRIEQGELSRSIESIRKVLKFVTQHQNQFDADVAEHAIETERDIDSKLTINQKLEFVLPIIPLVLNYRIEVGSESQRDFEVVLSELNETIQRLSRLAD